MKRLIVLLVVIGAVIVANGGAAVEARAETSGTSAKIEAAEALLETSLHGGAPQGAAVAEQSVSTASGAVQPDWLFGPASRSYYQDPFTGLILTYTMDWVGYWGTEDVSYPRVGDLYYGRVVVGNVAGIEAYPIVDVILPPHTTFDINSADQDRKIRCYIWDFLADPDGTNLHELTGSSCPTEPSPGFYGWNFNAPSAWRVEPATALLVDFPVRSTAALVGIAGPHCLVGAVKVGFLDDVPRTGETCPLADNHGAYQGVFVAPRVGGGEDDVPPVLKVAAAAKQKLRAALKSGVKSKATVNEAATIRSKLRLPAKLAKKLDLHRVVGKATRKLSAEGTVSIATKFTAKAKRKLAKLRSFKVVLKTTAIDSAGNKRVVKPKTIALRR